MDDIVARLTQHIRTAYVPCMLVDTPEDVLEAISEASKLRSDTTISNVKCPFFAVQGLSGARKFAPKIALLFYFLNLNNESGKHPDDKARASLPYTCALANAVVVVDGNTTRLIWTKNIDSQLHTDLQRRVASQLKIDVASLSLDPFRDAPPVRWSKTQMVQTQLIGKTVYHGFHKVFTDRNGVIEAAKEGLRTATGQDVAAAEKFFAAKGGPLPPKAFQQVRIIHTIPINSLLQYAKKNPQAIAFLIERNMLSRVQVRELQKNGVARSANGGIYASPDDVVANYTNVYSATDIGEKYGEGADQQWLILALLDEHLLADDAVKALYDAGHITINDISDARDYTGVYNQIKGISIELACASGDYGQDPHSIGQFFSLGNVEVDPRLNLAHPLIGDALYSDRWLIREIDDIAQSVELVSVFPVGPDQDQHVCIRAPPLDKLQSGSKFWLDKGAISCSY